MQEVAPRRRVRLAPSVFLSSLFCLKFANARMDSVTPILPTLSMNLVVSSHLEPKLEALSVNVSLVCMRSGSQPSEIQRTARNESASVPQTQGREATVGSTCESKAGFSIWQLTNTHRWFFTMKSFTFAFLFFLLIASTRCLLRNFLRWQQSNKT